MTKVDLALLATIDHLVYQGFFLLRFCTFWNDLCEFSIDNVKNGAISGLRRDFHLVIRIPTPYIIAIMY